MLLVHSSSLHNVRITICSSSIHTASALLPVSARLFYAFVLLYLSKIHKHYHPIQPIEVTQ